MRALGMATKHALLVWLFLSLHRTKGFPFSDLKPLRLISCDQNAGLVAVPSLPPPRASTVALFLSKAGNTNDSSTAQSNEPATSEDEGISDVDARVLREMLQDSKLDLKTEDDVRKLLERGITSKSFSSTSGVGKEIKAEEESMYQSELFQQFADSKLWRSLLAKTSDLIETSKLWLENKVENDVKTLAALGLFAWNRAVKDVARALPAAGSSVRKNIFMLTNISWVEEPESSGSAEDLREQLNRPSDEIRSVRQAVWGILNGNTDIIDESRGLRTIAKAGTTSMADRQKKAFEQSRRKRIEKSGIKEVLNIPGSIVDVTYELRQELKAERSTAGYKTKPIRGAIEAGVVGTGKYLQAIQENARLLAAERKLKRLEAERKPPEKGQEIINQQTTPNSRISPQSNHPTDNSLFTDMNSQTFTPKIDSKENYTQITRDMVELLVDLQIERDSILNRLTACIERPEEMLLQTELFTTEAEGLSEDSLQKVVILLNGLRDVIDLTLARLDNAETIDACLKQLRMILFHVETFRDSLAETLSIPMANSVFYFIVGGKMGFEGANEIPLVMRLDTLQDSYQHATEAVVEVTPEIVYSHDDLTEPRIEDSYVEDRTLKTQFFVVSEVGSNSLVAELIADDEFETAVGGAKPQKMAEEDILPQKPNLALTVVLRSLDVTFFILEKVLVVVIPRTIELASTAAKRYKEANQDGNGRKGWERITNLANPKGRY